MQQVDALLQQIPALAQIGGGLRLEDELHFLREFLDVIQLQGKRHATSRPHRVDGDGELRDSAVNRWLFEKQRLAAAR